MPQHQQLPQRGQCIKPQPAQETTLASSVAELVHDVIPQQQPTSASTERVDWVAFQQSDLADYSLLTKNCVNQAPPIVIVFGLARGYQIWSLMANGDCEELLSDRQGPVRVAQLITSAPQPCFNVVDDRFASSRPLIVIVDSISIVPERQFCTVSIVSLHTGETVHRLRYDEPVCGIRVSDKCMVVVFANKLSICDVMSFTEHIVLRGCYKCDDGTPLALNHQLVAFADVQLNSVYQSNGGVVNVDSLPSYTSQMISAAKSIGKTVSAIGESVVSSLSSASYGNKSVNMLSCNPGIVTVIDVERFPTSQSDIHDQETNDGILVHFAAHVEEPIGYMSFGGSGSILLTCGLSSQCFHLFLLLPHPTSPRLAAVHHLYTLFRGSTPAKVLTTAFSNDSRWLALTTNHGTTHIFPITPYGGAITMRTHGGRFVNRESRFLRSAGLIDTDTQSSSTSSTGGGGGTTTTSTNLPSSSPGTIRGSQLTRIRDAHTGYGRTPLARAALNPRLPPYPQPTVVSAVAKIRQRFLSSENLSAWASDMKSASLPKVGTSVSTKKHVAAELHRVAVAFAPQRANSDSTDEGFLICGHDGQLTEYQFKVKPSAILSGGKISPDSPIEMTVTAVAQWNLNRTKSSPDIRAPLTDSNPLMIGARSMISANDRNNTTAIADCDTNSNGTTYKQWISQVEMVTYIGPHRRLWMGPQFTFRTYLDSPTHSSANLVSPDDNHGRKPTAPMPAASRPSRSVPVVIEASSVGDINAAAIGVTREVCGSWSDNDYISCDDQEGKLRETIADAMRDVLVFAAADIVVESGGSADRDDQPSPMEDARSNFSDSAESPSHESLQFSSMDV